MNYTIMPSLVPDLAVAERLKTLFTGADFNEQGLLRHLGMLGAPARGIDDMPTLRQRLMQCPNASLLCLMRLFLFAEAVPRTEVAATLSAQAIEDLLASALVVNTEDSLQSTCIVVPCEGLLICADTYEQMLDPATRHEHVLTLNPATRHLISCLLREPTESVLDLGTGCGVFALLASRTAKRVVAVDINSRAIAYCRFNAWLNGIDNIEWRTASFFDSPGATFARIVCNPPFVIGPEQRFIYRDNPLELDGVCRELLRQASAWLQPGGVLQLIGEWACIESSDPTERLRAWVDGSGVDVLLLQTYRHTVSDYVAQRIEEERLVTGHHAEGALSVDQWMAFMHQHRVEAICGGVFTLQRTQRSAPWWLRLETRIDLFKPVAGEIRRLLDGANLAAEGLPTGQSLCLHPDVVLDQSCRPAEGGWHADQAQLRIEGLLPRHVSIDMPVALFLAELHHLNQLDAAIDRAAERLGAERAELAPVAQQTVGYLLQHGFVLLA